MSSNTMDTSSTNGHAMTKTQKTPQCSIIKTQTKPHLAIQEDKMDVEHVNKKKPIKRIVPDKIAEVGQWKVPKEEEDKGCH
ncbi:hypothetical protein KCU95_g11727, partial [Aureobasidium melanogenum]